MHNNAQCIIKVVTSSSLSPLPLEGGVVATTEKHIMLATTHLMVVQKTSIIIQKNIHFHNIFEY